MKPMLAIVGLWALAVCPALGRTIELTYLDLTGFAVISPEAPELGWVGNHEPPPPGRPRHFATPNVDLFGARTILMRFDLSQIPKDMRVINAELVMPTSYQAPDAHLAAYRILVDWGAGVCFNQRMIRPEKTPWAKPGAQGVGIDRALRPSARVHITKVETDIRINVTADVELWHAGSAPNHGWIFSGEAATDRFIFCSPVWFGRDRWRLRVTYEPGS